MNDSKVFKIDSKNSLLRLFDKLSFREWYTKIIYGLSQPKWTGDYKWAKFQSIRLSAPISGVLVPIIIILLLLLISSTIITDRTYTVMIQEPIILEKLDIIPEIIQDPIIPTEITETETETFITDEISIDNQPEPYSPQPSLFDSVLPNKSPVMLKGVFSSRTPGNIGSMVSKYSPGLNTESAVLKALRWLKTQQQSDGSWNQTKPAMTAFAILTYLAHGETPASDEFGLTVQYAIEYLISCQEADGRFKGRDGHDYTQPIAAYALCEAFGMTKIPEIKYAAEKAIKVVIDGQNKWGGFNYNLIGESDKRNDITYTSWCIQALKAAKMAGIYSENDSLGKCMKNAINGVIRNYGELDGYGGFGYTESGNKSSPLTGAGVLCLQLLGVSNSKECISGINGMSDWSFNWNELNTSSPLYHRYYITQAKFQQGGDIWNNWNRKFSPTLVKNQQTINKQQSGYVDHKGVSHDVGFWDSPSKDEHTGGNGRIMDTMLCTLMLEVYYRYLPTFQIVIQDGIADDLNNDNGNDDINIGINIPRK